MTSNNSNTASTSQASSSGGTSHIALLTNAIVRDTMKKMKQSTIKDIFRALTAKNAELAKFDALAVYNSARYVSKRLATMKRNRASALSEQRLQEFSGRTFYKEKLTPLSPRKRKLMEMLKKSETETKILKLQLTSRHEQLEELEVRCKTLVSKEEGMNTEMKNHIDEGRRKNNINMQFVDTTKLMQSKLDCMVQELDTVSIKFAEQQRKTLYESRKKQRRDRTILKLKSEEKEKRERNEYITELEKKLTLSKQEKEPTNKRRKCKNDGEDATVDLEVKQKVENNKLSAELKLSCRKYPVISLDIGISWFHILKPEFSKEYFGKLDKYIQSQRTKKTIHPSASDVWSWTQNCDINDVKVVILGQDPYHGPNQAHGLCFSVQKGVPAPPSLVNIYKELVSDIPDFKRPSHGNLTGWAAQGVLLLNACLTVRQGEANSHKDQGWEKITDAVVKWINNNSNNVVFMLWGKDAQRKGACINKNKHLVLSAVHPSPLSASRGFFGCKHFSKANEYLTKNKKSCIDWNRLP